MVMDLKNMCKLYDRRVQQALIPFYIERIDYLNDEIDKAEFPKDISFLEKLRDELKSEQALEEKAIKDQANGIYKLWRDVCDLRKEGNPQTSAKLSVHKGTPKGLDVLFNINEEQRQG